MSWLQKKCNFADRPNLSPAAREAGCPLDHCSCGTHDVDHNCEIPDVDPEMEAAERKAGWDPNP